MKKKNANTADNTIQHNTIFDLASCFWERQWGSVGVWFGLCWDFIYSLYLDFALDGVHDLSVHDLSHENRLCGSQTLEIWFHAQDAPKDRLEPTCGLICKWYVWLWTKCMHWSYQFITVICISFCFNKSVLQNMKHLKYEQMQIIMWTASSEIQRVWVSLG